ncbi:MAG: hydroxyacid dehydrogenase [Desulfarculus sp.]|jgi:D-3-phosphoglycerate dehydrogenase|nr:MAG: hydroxyacid dehydrogenase [Desulfarculus sp.]
MAGKFKVLMYEPMHQEGTKLLESRCELVYAQSFDEQHLLSLVPDVDALVIRANGAVTKAILEAALRLKVIGRHGVGLDGIDLEAAKRRGVVVVYTPTANTQSVAEHFVGLAITLAKKLRSADQALRAGRWQSRYELIGAELNGKTLGVLGFGRIGQQTARICRLGFNMPVIYYDVVNYPQAEAELGARRLEMAAVFQQADFISINLPLLPSTQGCVNAQMLGLMKPSAFLLNMARGPIWNEADVYQALAAGRIAGVGADVYAQEPALADNSLFGLDSFVGSPHMSAHTEEAMVKMSLVARDVLAVLEGRKPHFPVPGFE